MLNLNLLQDDRNLVPKWSSDLYCTHSSDPFMVHVYCKQYIISHNYYVRWYHFYCEFPTVDYCDGRW